MQLSGTESHFVRQVYISFFHVTPDSGMERAFTQSSLSVCLLPSMDYLWAGDDCSTGLQSGWLGSGKFLPHFLTHPRGSKAIVHSLTAISILQHPLCQMWKCDSYLAKWYYSVCTLLKQFESWNQRVSPRSWEARCVSWAWSSFM